MTSNILVNDIIIGNRLSREGLIAAYDRDGKFVSGAVTASSIYVRVLKTGDIMTGILSMNNNKIINVGEPTDNIDAATKKYVDAKEIPLTTSLTTIRDGMTTLN